MTEAAIGLGADIALVITPYYARPTQDGLFAWYSAIAVDVPRDADRPVQRADPHRGRRGPRDGRPPAPGPRQHRRDQGDDEGLRALLPDLPPLRSRPVDVVGHRVALPAAPGDRRHRLRQRRRQHRPHGGRRHVRPLGGGRSPRPRSTSTTPFIPLVDLLFVETNPAPIKRVLRAVGPDRLRLRPTATDPGHRAGHRPIDALLVEGLPALDGPPAELARTLAAADELVSRP